MKLAWIGRSVSVPLEWKRQALSTFCPLMLPILVHIMHSNPEQVIVVELWTVSCIEDEAINAFYGYIDIGRCVNSHHSVLGTYFPENRVRSN